MRTFIFFIGIVIFCKSELIFAYSYKYDSKEIEALFSEIMTEQFDNSKEFIEPITEEVKLYPDKNNETNTDELEKILKEAYEHLENLDLYRAKALFQKVMASENRKFISSAIYGLGECYYIERNYQKAYKLWTQLRSYQDNFSKKADRKLQYLNDILSFFNSNLYGFSENKEFNNANEAKNDFIENKYESSCIKCLKILKDNPKNLFAYFQLALNYRALRKYGVNIKKMDYFELEKQQYEKILQMNNSPYAYNNLGMLYFEKEDYARAIENFKNAVKYDEIGEVKELAKENIYRTRRRMPDNEKVHDTYILE